MWCIYHEFNFSDKNKQTNKTKTRTTTTKHRQNNNYNETSFYNHFSLTNKGPEERETSFLSERLTGKLNYTYSHLSPPSVDLIRSFRCTSTPQMKRGLGAPAKAERLR